MTSLHQFLTWLKERSKKGALGEDGEEAEVEEEAHAQQFAPQHAPRMSSVRASMKLPPIPREAMRMKWAQRNWRESPSIHIYEEIDNYEVLDEDATTPCARTTTETIPEVPENVPREMDMQNLDFAKAKEFGPYLVVPIKDKMNFRGHVVMSPTPDGHFQQVTHHIPPGFLPPSEHRAEYLGDFSSADSGFHSFSSGDNLQCACPKCHRPQSMCACDRVSHKVPEASRTPPQLSPRATRTVDPRRQNCVLTNLQAKFEECLSMDEVQSCVRVEAPEPIATPSKDPRRRIVHFADDALPRDTPEGSKGDASLLSVQCDPRLSCSISNNKLNFKLSPRSISESDSGNSSVYAYSGSEKEAKMGVRDCLPRTLESDSSNDTFSEYDLQGAERPRRGDPEYAYFLNKARYNLWLKEDVMRVIRESESSEYESSAPIGPDNSDDTLSLTTVTSLSDSSVLSLDDPLQEILRAHRRGSHTSHKVYRHKKSKGTKHSEKKRHDGSSESGKGAKELEAGPSTLSRSSRKDASREGHRRDPDRNVRTKCAKCSHVHSKRDLCKGGKRKGGASKHSMEYYTLPDFPKSALDVSPREDNSVLSDSVDKLSCRATNYHPVSLPTTPQKPTTSTSTSATATATATATASSTTPTTTTTPNQTLPRRREQNRMLSDLMKKNHDRLLVLF